MTANSHCGNHVNGVACAARVVVLLAVVAAPLSRTVEAGELVPPPDANAYFADEENSARFEERALNYLNELSARRRLTTVFPNEQSAFYGVRLNYVNVGEGNLTFLMRDLVRAARLPIVFGRVYDSRKQDDADFGRGWKLAVAESLELRGNELVYTDASNSTYVLETNGSRIRSAYPHLTGIQGGLLEADRAIITIGDLTKIFQRRGDRFRFAEVRDRSENWLTFEYTNGSVSRILSSSGRFVDIVRDDSGRIEGARDDAGRTIRYSYDEAGALRESIAIDGSVSRYGYDENGYLSEIVDARGFESIAVEFRSDGRVASVDSQHENTAFEYGAGTTTVRNAQQQAATFTFHSSGLVESVTDFAGGISSLEFDQDLRVQRLGFNGDAVAFAGYRDGQLSLLRRLDSQIPRQQRFVYDSQGRLASVRENGIAIAAYDYDVFGRVTYAVESNRERASEPMSADGPENAGPVRDAVPGTERRYRYDRRGDLSGVSIDDAQIRYRVNRLGMIDGVAWADNNAIDIRYTETDRIGDLRFRFDEIVLGAHYEYDEAGYRVSGDYDAFESFGNTGIALDYDSAGNLIRIEMPELEGRTRVIEHTIGSENELLRITPIGSEAFEQVIDYDESGRARRSVQGSGQRDAVFEYDELGRLTDVYLDRQHALTSDHGPMELDPIHGTDARTPFTATNVPVVSAVFGSIEETIYTRPVGSPYGIARFVPEMARFVILDNPVVPPDALLLASLKRRNLASVDTLDATPIQGLDKPSSSLFLPPEYFATNCAFCAGGVSGYEIERVGSGPIQTGQSVSFFADGSDEYCFYFYLDGYEPVIINHSYWHFFSGGSGSGTFITSTPAKTFNTSFPDPGQKTVQDTLECGCGGIFLAQAQETVSVCEDPYVWHISNPAATFSYSASKSGSLSSGQITFEVDIFTFTQQEFDDFEQWVESYWDTSVSGGGVNLTINVSLTRTLFEQSADVKVVTNIIPPPGGSSPPPEACGTYNTGPNPDLLTINSDGGIQCQDDKTAAHEFGHLIGFDDAYIPNDHPNAMHCDNTDLMAWGDQIHDYHGRVLWEKN